MQVQRDLDLDFCDGQTSGWSNVDMNAHLALVTKVVVIGFTVRNPLATTTQTPSSYRPSNKTNVVYGVQTASGS